MIEQTPPAAGHPEAICQRCGGPNPIWHAPSDLWNRVMGGPNGIVCPTCFILLSVPHGLGLALWNLEVEELE